MTEVTYGVTEEIYSLGGEHRTYYGIASYAVSEQDGTASIVLSVHDICADKQKLTELVEKCNRLKLSLVHLEDVLDDFLAE